MKQNNSLRVILSIILIALVVALVYFIGRLILTSQQPVDVKAVLSPKEVIVSNLTANSTVISWYSDESIEGYIKYGSEADQFTTQVLDFRDTTVPSARNLFYVRIDNLLPERTYYFQITTGTDNFSTPQSTYSFTTLKSVDEISVPSPLLISASGDFIEGIAYVHASNGDNISTTASVYTTNPNISIDKSSLKDKNTGLAFEVGDGNILVSITSSDGKRASGVIAADESNLSLNSVSASGQLYKAGTVVANAEVPISTPVSSPEVSPGDTTNNPISLASCNSTCDANKYCLCPSNCVNPSGVYQSISNRIVCGGDKVTLPPTGSITPPPAPTPTPTPVPPPTTLPSTDVDSNLILAVNVFFGILLITLGYQLRRK
ncbi:MAG: fibronectin type III domain-containing protein [Candidatus Dojkabacteria bacterium]